MITGVGGAGQWRKTLESLVWKVWDICFWKFGIYSDKYDMCVYIGHIHVFWIYLDHLFEIWYSLNVNPNVLVITVCLVSGKILQSYLKSCICWKFYVDYSIDSSGLVNLWKAEFYLIVCGSLPKLDLKMQPLTAVGKIPFLSKTNFLSVQNYFHLWCQHKVWYRELLDPTFSDLVC